MYEDFYGFRERPFDLSPNPKFLVLTESHQEVLLNLEYGIASRKGVTLLIGEAGSGKTTVIRAAMEKQPVKVHCVHLHNPTLSRQEFNELLATRFGLSEQAMVSKAAMLTELEALLLARRDADEKTVLIVDEAQSLPLDLLEEIRLLANIETDSEKLLSVIIAGQPELAARLNERALRQFKQRVALRCELKPLTPQETAAYIVGRIRAAGGVAAEVFTRQAVAMMHERAQGLPRTISVIADNALLGGFAAGQRPVGADLVAEICRDFDIGGPVSHRGREATPTSSIDAPPARSVDATPTRSVEATPTRTLEATPTRSMETVPARNMEASPTGSMEASPTRSIETASAAETVVSAAPNADVFGTFAAKRKRLWFFSS